MKMLKFLLTMCSAVSAGTLLAAGVALDEAAGAARRWAEAGGTLGVRLGAKVKTSGIRTFSAGGSAKVYAVPFEDGGVVFMSSDTRMEPVVAFTGGSGADLSEDSPLAVLLKKDALLRAKLLEAEDKDLASVPRTAVTSSAVRRSSGYESRWAQLLGRTSSVAGTGAVAASAKPIASVVDERVAPLLKSRWSQQKADDRNPFSMNCYNYYTPKNYPCGCTATAVSQIMRYFVYPDHEVPSAEYSCTVDGAARVLSTLGGIYDWEAMTLEPKNGIEESNAQAIGRLTYDVGVALNSDYAQGATGALPDDVARMMRSAFGYANAYSFWSESAFKTAKGGLHLLSLREKVIYSNLDAGKPVQLGIYGYDGGGEWGGHAVVADGYGFSTVAGGEATAFVHINMGWGGVDDLWYNIPEIDAANTGAQYDSAATTYSYMAAATFNVDAADAGFEIVSGRVLNGLGEVVAGAAVELRDGGNATVATALTDKNGIYFFKVPGGARYTALTASDDGRYVAASDEIVLTKTVGNAEYCIVSENSIGNSWGNDLKLDIPVAEVAGAGYASLELAFAAAKEAASPAEIKVVRPAALKKSLDVDFKCVLTSAAADPASTEIARVDAAAFNVKAGGEIVFSNIVFAADSSTVVNVEAGGMAAVSGKVGFQVSGAAAVRTADADGFAIYGSCEMDFSLDCAAAVGIPGVFGKLYGLDRDEAAKTAALVANFQDDTGEVRGSVEGDAAPFVLKWDEVQVPVEVSSCYYVDGNGVTNTSARISRLFARLGGELSGGEIVVRKSAELSEPLEVTGDAVIRGEDGVTLTLTGPDSGFVDVFKITAGTLSVSNLVFSDFEGETLFKVDGGSLELLSGAVIEGAVGISYHSGAIAVMRGSATVGEGAVISGCSVYYPYGEGCGGAVYVAGGAELNLRGCTITGCTASAAGGVYADRRASRINLSGKLTVAGNYNDYGLPSNIYAYNAAVVVTVEGAVEGDVGIAYGGTGNVVNQRFAYLAEGVAGADKAAVARSAKSFFSDVTADVEGSLSDDGTGLVWNSASVAVSVPDDLQEWAVAKVVHPSGAELSYWSAADALLSATNSGATVQMLLADGLDEEVTLPADRVLFTSADPAAAVEVAGGTIVVPEDRSLLLSDIWLSGGDMLDIAGGEVVLKGAVGGDIGTRGGTAEDPNIFGAVECDLAFDSLTNSASSFLNRELGAYGVVLTNAASADAVLVWSTAVDSDGSYTRADGSVWYCVGDIPVNEITVDPQPIAFSAISFDAGSGMYTLTVTNLVAGCWYSLYATNSLSGGFAVESGVTAPVTNFQAEVDGAFDFTVPAEGDAKFWKVIGESGTIEK